MPLEQCYLLLKEGRSFEPIPLTHTHSPCCNNPTGHAEDQQDCAGADGHQGLHDKTSVKADFVECSDAAGGSVCEQLAVEQHDPTNQVEAQEHRHREDDVDISVRH